MPETTPGETANTTAPPKKSLILIGFLLLIIVAGGAYYFFVLNTAHPSQKNLSEDSESAVVVDKKNKTVATSHDGEKKSEAIQTEDISNKTPPGEKKDIPDTEEKFGKTYQLEAFHLNLGNPLENHYIRLKIAIEYLGGDKQEQEIKTRMPQLRDAVLTITSRKTREFLLAPDGKDQLRLELLNRINAYMEEKIENVYITDILIE